jgi:glycosyltransferase involved in cell wall biosynthesis
MQNESNLIVSVVMITYAHEKYIQEAIEGVFLQQFNGTIELIIANDHSPDATDEIVKRVIKNAPQHIKVNYTYHEINKGMMPNFVWALQQTNGKYIAICEGDDYWTDPLKLQKQVDFLEENKEYSICGTYCDVEFKEGLENRIAKDFIIFDHFNIISSNIVPTLTTCFRNDLIKYDFFIDYPIGDIPLLLELTKSGLKGAKLPFISGVYRYHGNGANSGKTRFKNSELQLLTKFVYLKNNPDLKYKIFFKKYLIRLVLEEIKHLLKLRIILFNYRIIYASLKYYLKV